MIFVDTYDKLQECLNWLNEQSLIGLDTETNGLDPITSKVLLIQIGTEVTQYVIDTYKLKEHIPTLLNTLNLPFLKKVLHNAVFDYGMLYSNYNFQLDNFVCTLTANKLLNQGRKTEHHSLAALLDKYLSIKLDKETRSSFIDMKYGDNFTEDQIKYSGLDVKYLPKLFGIVNNLIKLRNLSLVAELEYETIKVTAEMQIKGIYIDQEKWLDLKKEAEVLANNAFAKAEKYFAPYCTKDMFGDLLFDQSLINAKQTKKTVGKPKKVKTTLVPFNINSNIQTKAILEKILGHPLDSTDSKYLAEFDHPAIDALLEYRKYYKLITTYGEEFITDNVHPVTKRIHTTFKQLGTESGRYSSDHPNLQNIPHQQSYRTPFCVQSPDRRIISADFSAQELALIAKITQEPNFIEALKSGKDVHCYSASLLHNIPYEQFFDYDENGNVIGFNKKMKKEYRDPTKSITFGLVYGMGPGKLAKQLNISFSEAKTLIDKYFKMFPQVKIKLNEFVEALYKNKYAYSPLDGRRRDFSDIDWDDKKIVSHAVNAAKNLPFQGSGASITKLAMCNIRRRFLKENLDAFIILTVHDEVLVECHESIATTCAKIVEIEMIEAFNYFAPDIPMKVDAQIGTHWIH
jgi:DNA polymerase I-like protein with 3'-5' exonuclease and polymerase domains